MSFADKTNVVFHTLTKEQIEFYIDKYKPYDKSRCVCNPGMDWSCWNKIYYRRFL
ncbi:MAG: hypothetical protein WDM71_05405 [Ferruginibacter sp.]